MIDARACSGIAFDYTTAHSCIWRDGELMWYAAILKLHGIDATIREIRNSMILQCSQCKSKWCEAHTLEVSCSMLSLFFFLDLWRLCALCAVNWLAWFNLLAHGFYSIYSNLECISAFRFVANFISFYLRFSFGQFIDSKIDWHFLLNVKTSCWNGFRHLNACQHSLFASHTMHSAVLAFLHIRIKSHFRENFSCLLSICLWFAKINFSSDEIITNS